jgi:hypothetical protein
MSAPPTKRPYHTSMTREGRIERARNAGKIAQSPETYAKNLVRGWPELTPEQAAKIRVLLRPVIGGGNG